MEQEGEEKAGLIFADAKTAAERYAIPSALRNTQNIQIWNVPETAEEQKRAGRKKDEDFINCSTML